MQKKTFRREWSRNSPRRRSSWRCGALSCDVGANAPDSVTCAVCPTNILCSISTDLGSYKDVILVKDAIKEWL